MQVCPAYPNPPAAQRCAARSRSASGSITTPALPPSSSVTFFLPHLDSSIQPTGALPVKLSSLNRASTTHRSASTLSQGTTLRPPGGTPASTATSPKRSAVRGVCGAGLIRIELPAARAGATLCATRFKGKLKGVMPSTGPIGKRRRIPRWESVPGVQSSGRTSPGIRFASSAATVKV